MRSNSNAQSFRKNKDSKGCKVSNDCVIISSLDCTQMKQQIEMLQNKNDSQTKIE